MLDLIFFYFNPVKSENKYNDPYLGENNIIKIKNLRNSYMNGLEVTSTMSFNIKKQLKADIINYGNEFINLLTLDTNLSSKASNKNAFDIDIESDIQYQKNNIYFAEGNVIINFSNFSIKGDKLIYDKLEKTLSLNGNVVFSKGNQYFEATKVFYNLKLNEGFIDNIYGVIYSKTLVKDFEFKDTYEIINPEDINEIDNFEYISNANQGLTNNFEEREIFNIAKSGFNISSINKWRYKSDRLILQNDIVQSKKILITNDPINKPQFVLKSKDFTGEIVDKKIKIIIGDSRIILDNKFSFPIGKRTIFEEDQSSSWEIGSDFKEKDGFYISKDFDNIKINNDFKFNYEPIFLLQRALQGSTKSYTKRNESIFSKKVKDDIDLSDMLALNTELEGNIYKWDLNWQTKLNSFNPDRLSESFRTKFYIKKRFNLNSNINNINPIDNSSNSKYSSSQNILIEEKFNQRDLDIDRNYIIQQVEQNNKKEIYENFLDIKISSAFREKISRGYSGESEIYFGNSLSVANKMNWFKNEHNKNLNLIYDFGKFKAETKEGKSFNNLYRNVFAIQLSNSFPIYKIRSEDKNINSEYRYTPSIIYPGIYWGTNMQSGLFLYSNGKSQEAISLSSGPEINFGLFKKDFLDFTYINLKGVYVLKKGESPFKFDDINKDFRINWELKQQLIGPLAFSYGNSYKFKEGKFSLPKYGLDINRRAYSLGLFYDSQNQRGGLKFSIFNPDYNRRSSKF